MTERVDPFDSASPLRRPNPVSGLPGAAEIRRRADRRHRRNAAGATAAFLLIVLAGGSAIMGERVVEVRPAATPPAMTSSPTAMPNPTLTDASPSPRGTPLPAEGPLLQPSDFPTDYGSWRSPNGPFLECAALPGYSRALSYEAGEQATLRTHAMEYASAAEAQASAEKTMRDLPWCPRAYGGRVLSEESAGVPGADWGAVQRWMLACTTGSCERKEVVVGMARSGRVLVVVEMSTPPAASPAKSLLRATALTERALDRATSHY